MSAQAPPAVKSELQIALDELSSYRTRVPSSYPDWSYQRTIDFKGAQAQAAKILSRARPSQASVKDALVELRRFYDQ